jgi:hypothetical protein
MFNFEKYLENHPLACERKWKSKAIGAILSRKYGIDEYITQTSMAELVRDVTSMDRKWRKIMQERPELRGDDYQEKNELEKHAKKQLGYQT